MSHPFNTLIVYQVRVSLPTTFSTLSEPLGSYPDHRFNQPAAPLLDQPFLLRIAEVIEARLDDGSLSSGNLHVFVPTSRATLHRLLHKYAGLSASDYLNLYRVRRSLEYLFCAHRSISDVASCVGMNNSAYTRAFKAVFGLTPSEYRRMKI